jgi:ribosomal protein L37AE/L43A
MPAKSDTTRGYYRYEWHPADRDERGDAIWRWHAYVCPAGWDMWEAIGAYDTEADAQATLAAQGIPATDEGRSAAAIWCPVPYDYEALRRQEAEAHYWERVATTPYAALDEYRHVTGDEIGEPEYRCVVCQRPISAHAARYRGVTHCRKCAAKARGMTLAVQQAGGQARGAQLKRAWDAAKASGLI